MIFLHRKSSLRPFTRVLHSENASLLDSFTCDSDGCVSVEGTLKGPLRIALRKYNEVWLFCMQ